MPENNDDSVQDNHPIKPREAREQASDYLGFMAGVTYDLGDGETWELPNPAFMDPDMKNRYLEHLRFMTEDLDTVNRKDPITGEMRPVQKYPLRKDNKLINDDELLCIALMGSKALYQKFLKAGGVPGQLNTAWQVMQRQLQERTQQDSKSS